AADDGVGVERPDRLQDFDFLIPDRLAISAHGRFHRQVRDDLQQVVLHHVAYAADAIVKRAATLYAELLGHRDLYAFDVPAIPDRLEDLVGETEVEQIADRRLAQVMIDAEDRALVEVRE